METIYPSNEEIKFRDTHHEDIKKILKEEVKCTICKIDLLNEIISKKMIVVHKSYLFLCCYNCFYKLCEGHEYSCILCKSNDELSNCEKCNLNVCNRCIENHKINQVSKGIINNCFNCKLNILWKSRAQTANILKIFYSQLDLPNGLLVNELDREQSVRKYLVEEAKNGQNSITNKIKDQMCLNFVFHSYKPNIIKKLSELSPETDDTLLLKECISNVYQICEYILEKTCSTLTDLTRIFDLNTNLNPHISAIMKSLLKSVDGDENVLNNSKYNNDNISKADKSLNISCTKKTNNAIQPNNIETEKRLTVLLERFDDSILSKYKIYKAPDNVNSDEKDETNHTLNLFDDINSSDDECTKTLRSRKIIKTNTKKRKKLTKKTNLPDLSDDERENNRLINLNNIEYSLKKKNTTDDSDISSIILPTCEIKNNELKKSTKNVEDKINAMKQTIENIDEIDSGADNNSDVNDEYSLKSVKDIFNEVYPLGISQINSEFNSSESDDSSMADLVNECTSIFYKHKTDSNCNKNQENQSNLPNIGSSDELQNEENIVCSDMSDKDKDPKVINRSKKLSPFNMPSTEDSEDSDSKNEKMKKRKVLSSNSFSNSDSSSKYFKKTPKKRQKLTNGRKCNSTHNKSNSSSNNSDSDFTCIKSKNYKRPKIISSSESNSESVQGSDEINANSTKGRKNIRKMKKLDSLSELTKDALKEEASRKVRVQLRQKMYNEIFNPPTPVKSYKKLVLDFDPKTKEELVVVHPELVKFLKPHQIDGVKFLWDSVFESLSLIKTNHKGSGTILAHCMGLGKTLQVITLVHTLFKFPEIGIKTVLIVTPHATIENWCNEFQKWLGEIPEENNFIIFNFSESKTYKRRENIINDWRNKTGVLITSYQLFRTVVNFKNIKKYPDILEGFIDPGPDLIICDEGHLLKNHNSATSKVINTIKTRRRIVLTGTPLQNNLKEYHCMVDFIRPNLLGSLKDFTNRFINPITNGQYSDSTPMDVRLMKRRSHVLHRMLGGFVQRCDYSVLTPYLPPKNEYVIYLKLSNKQIELYRNYLDNFRQTELFSNYHILQMVWTHPKLLEMYSKRIETKREKQKLKESDFNDDYSSEIESSIEETENDQPDIPIPGFDTTNTKIADMDLNWWKPLVTKKELESVYPYSKFIMMFSILQECEEIGDKVIIFSQSLYTLDLIQEFLENAADISDNSGMDYGRSWILGEDFMRIDGSVSLKDREFCCEKFNDITNTKNRLLLLSTKAFNLGINLVAANRVIIFDVTWNPSLNVQSIFRVFRFGQNKPCYIYRLISEGTMEQKIYERQISKLSMAFRVVDEHQIDRHFNAKNQEELYEFEPKTSEPKTTLNLPKDRLMAELILKHKDLVMEILEHDSLLQNNEAEELDKNDREAAWEDYQKEKEGLLNKEFEQSNVTNNMFLNSLNSNIPRNNQYHPPLHTSNSDDTISTEAEDVKLFNTLRNFFPQASMIQLNDMLIQVKSKHNEP